MLDGFVDELRKMFREEATAIVREVVRAQTGEHPLVKLISRAEAALLMGNTDPRTVKKLQEAGKLKLYGNARNPRVDEHELLRYLASAEARGDKKAAAAEGVDEWAQQRLQAVKK